MLALILSLGGCKSKKAASEGESTPEEPLMATPIETPAMVPGGMASVIPSAIVYKTLEDFYDNVPVAISYDGNDLVSYPDPSDITPEQMPLVLTDGYLLDRRGISNNVAFTSYSYEEYAALKTVPSKQQLMKSIVSKAPLKEIYRLPMTIGEAVADTAAVNDLIRGGFEGCTNLMKRVTLEVE
jgi:hypothetical protein